MKPLKPSYNTLKRHGRATLLIAKTNFFWRLFFLIHLQQASTSGSSSSSCTAAQTESMDVTPTPEGVTDSQLPVSSWEPMLCSEAEDGVAPLSLELLYISAQVTSPSDAIMVAGHLLMTETGFIPQVRRSQKLTTWGSRVEDWCSCFHKISVEHKKVVV